MKKQITVIGAILVVVGLSLFAIAFASVGFNPAKLNSQVSFEQKQFSVEAGKVQALNISDENNTIELTRAADQNITITYYESEKDRYEVGVDGNSRLTMRYVNDRKWYERIGVEWGHPDTRITVALPEGFRCDLTLGTVNGSIRADGQAAGSLQATVTNGDIRLTGVSVDQEATVSTVNGQIVLDSLAAGSISVSSVNGRVQVNGASSSGAVTLSTTNGSISGTLAGSASDYTVSAGTVNGTNNLTNSIGGTKSLSVHTTNGSIDIKFQS